MALAKRSANATAAEPEFVPFLSLGFYVGGGTMIPPGDYALEHEIMMHQATNKTTRQTFGDPRLVVKVTAYPIGDPDPEGNKKEQHLGMGSKAHLSFAPSNDGKRLVAKPGASGANLDPTTNWAIYLKSIFNCDPDAEDALRAKDLSALDGMWVSIQNVPEPEERKGYRAARAATGEAGMAGSAGDLDQRDRKIPVVSAILDGGKPWEGGGGMPEPAGTASNGKAAPTTVKSVAQSVVAKAAPAESPNGNVRDAAIAATAAVLGTVDKAGISKVKLRNSTFKAAQKSQGQDMAEAVIEEFFGTDSALSGLLEEHGFVLVGDMAKPDLS